MSKLNNTMFNLNIPSLKEHQEVLKDAVKAFAFFLDAYLERVGATKLSALEAGFLIVEIGERLKDEHDPMMDIISSLEN